MKNLSIKFSIVHCLLLFSCGQPEYKNADSKLFIMDRNISYNDIASMGYKKVPVDVNMFEKKVKENISINVTFEQDLEQLVSQSWLFYMKNQEIGENQILNLMKQYDLSLASPICTFDSIYSFFSLLDQNRRVFLGKRVMTDTVCYVEVSYYFPKNE